MRRLSASSAVRLRGRHNRIPPQRHRPSNVTCRILSSSSTAAQTERQRLHEEKAALARAAKEERRRLYEQKRLQAEAATKEPQRLEEERRAQAQERRERHVQAQVQAIERQLEAKRKNASRSIPYWLGNNPRCFDLTMEALNLKSVKSNKDGIAAEYKQIYLHTIPSFYQTLEEEESLKDVLDALVDAGFDDLKWAKNHRQRMQNQPHLDRLDALIIKTKVKCEKLEAKLKAFQARLERTKQEEAAMNEEEPPVEEPLESSLIGRALNAVSSLILGVKEDTSQQSPVKNKSERVKRQESATLGVEKQLEGIQRNLKNLEEERDSYKFSITQQEYDRTNKVVDSVMGDICQAFASHIHKRHSEMIDQYRTLDSKTDLTKPHDWYMHARLDKRKVTDGLVWLVFHFHWHSPLTCLFPLKIIFHAGPTNSGKTWTALERLKTAKRGLYLGPLRLLAAEIYETLTSQGVYTNLFTGQEKREIPFATHIAATVEIASTTDEFDVVVIDEIQMISDPFRGFAWTRALLGIRCKEIHVCGGLEAQSIVQKIADFCGDDLETIRYERFSPLHVQNDSLATHSKELGSYKAVQPGDCVVAFSRNDIFAIKREIEEGTDYKCCIIYGSLPPETRTDQARRFNDPDSGYDILVASDAIGMGLNLNIRRVIFNSLFKFTGDCIVQLDHSSVKQISGRAGRRNSPFPDGQVTCRDPEDMEYLRQCMSTEIAPIEKAGLLPTAAHIELFNDALKKYELGNDYDNLYKILVQFSEVATLKGDFFLCRQTPMQIVAKILNDVDLPLSDKYTLCMAPVTTKCSRAMTTLKQFALKHSQGQVSGVPR